MVHFEKFSFAARSPIIRAYSPIIRSWIIFRRSRSARILKPSTLEQPVPRPLLSHWIGWFNESPKRFEFPRDSKIIKVTAENYGGGNFFLTRNERHLVSVSRYFFFSSISVSTLYPLPSKSFLASSTRNLFTKHRRFEWNDLALEIIVRMIFNTKFCWLYLTCDI